MCGRRSRTRPGCGNPFRRGTAAIDARYSADCRRLASRRRSASTPAPPGRRGTPPPSASVSSAYASSQSTRRSSTSSSPARAASAVMLPAPPRAKNSGHTSLSTRASTIGKIDAHPQLRRSPHTAAIIRPPGRRVGGHLGDRRVRGRHVHQPERAQRCIERRPVTERLARALRRRIAASRPVRGHTRGRVVPCRRPCVPRCRWRRTRPSLPTAAAAGRVTMPVPQATSTTDSPGWSAASASTASCAGLSWSRQHS